MLQTGLVAGADWAGVLQSEWKALAQNSPTASPFQTWEWHSTWWKHYGSGKRPLILTIKEGGDLVGLMPLVRIAGPWRALRAMGSGPADYLHPLALHGQERAVGEAIAEWLTQQDKGGLVDLHQIRDDKASYEPLKGLANAKAIEQATCLVLDLPKSYEEYLQVLSKSLRYDVRKLDKALFTENKAEIKRANTNEGMEILFEQHKLRWKKRGLPGVFFGRAKRFHQEWAELAAKNGWLWLSTLHLEGKAVGAIYAMQMHGTCYYYQAGFDPSASSISPGTLLVANTIRRAIEEGCTRFDFLRGDEPYKRRWKPQHAYKNYRILLPSESLLGKIGMDWNELGLKIETRIRARLEGRGLF